MTTNGTMTVTLISKLLNFSKLRCIGNSILYNGPFPSCFELRYKSEGSYMVYIMKHLHGVKNLKHETIKQRDSKQLKLVYQHIINDLLHLF